MIGVEAIEMIKVGPALDVVGHVSVDELDVDVIDTAVAEGLIGLFDGERDEILLDVVVMARGEFGVGDDEREGDVAGLGRALSH